MNSFSNGKGGWTFNPMFWGHTRILQKLPPFFFCFNTLFTHCQKLKLLYIYEDTHSQSHQHMHCHFLVAMYHKAMKDYDFPQGSQTSLHSVSQSLTTCGYLVPSKSHRFNMNLSVSSSRSVQYPHQDQSIFPPYHNTKYSSEPRLYPYVADSSSAGDWTPHEK